MKRELYQNVQDNVFYSLIEFFLLEIIFISHLSEVLTSPQGAVKGFTTLGWWELAKSGP
jgi:hypothetical protein